MDKMILISITDILKNISAKHLLLWRLVYTGGALQMWKNYFGEGTRVIGIDITPETKEFEEGLY